MKGIEAEILNKKQKTIKMNMNWRNENMQKKNGLIRCYNKICDWFSVKKISLMTVLFFMLMLIPVLYLSFVNRASGDDYGYGTFTRAAWVSSHSLIEVFKAACYTIEHYYTDWQGTWFSIFVFSLQPEVFSEKAYVIVAFLMLSLWIGSTFLLFREVLIEKLKFDTWSFLLITVLFLFINIQFIPSTKSSIFWFNGCAHYMLPFTMCQLLAYWLLHFSKVYKVGYLLGISILMTLLGGSNYQAALFSLIVAVYICIGDFILKRNKKIFLLVIPVILELAGLFISMIAPGNKVRAGEDFGFSVDKATETVVSSFIDGVKLIREYLVNTPMIFILLAVVLLFMLEAVKKRKEQTYVKYPMIVALALFCLYSAMQAPEIYAGVEVSSGVYNMNFQTFLLMMTGLLYLIAEMVTKLLDKRSISTQKAESESDSEESMILHRTLVIPGAIVCLFLLLLTRSDIKECTTWECLMYITSGQAADYKEQMDLQTVLLIEEDTKDVVLPFINDVQGPLMQMPVTADETAWTNTVTAQFYGKRTTVAMPRPEWETLYGAEKHKNRKE